jgi:hypothetical protein
MKITLDEATLSKAVITHLRGVGVQSDILKVEFRYTRVPYTVFAEVELADATLAKPTRVRVPIELAVAEVPQPAVEQLEPSVDPDTLPPLEEPAAEEPRPETPAAPLFGGG